MKSHPHKSYDNLLSLLKSDWLWQNVLINFITDSLSLISRWKACDALLVVKDWHLKMMQYIYCTKNIDTPELTELLILKVYSKFGALRSIVSNRGSLFTLKWWSTFCNYIIIKRFMSTAFHSQTDRQTKWMNQTLKCYLHCYINNQQHDWVKLLSSAKYTYNNCRQSSTNKTPFELCLCFDPAIHMWSKDKMMKTNKVPSAKKMIFNKDDEIYQRVDLWKQAQKSMLKFYD